MVLTAGAHGALWLSGWRSLALAEAVEQGAALTESRRLGEVHDDTIRRSIRTQRDTLPFWTALTLFGDFVVDPLALGLRALALATIFSALAALSGRPVKFTASLAWCSAVQGIWVLGMAVRLGMIAYLRDPEAQTSLTLALPAGTYPAPVWVALQQFDLFVLVGWFALGWGAWRLGQVNVAGATIVCGLAWSLESVSRIAWTLIIESGMRLRLVPEWVAR
jgi:hypothetical protein